MKEGETQWGSHTDPHTRPAPPPEGLPERVAIEHADVVLLKLCLISDGLRRCDLGLRLGMALLGCFAEPNHGLSIIQFDAYAVGIASPKIILRFPLLVAFCVHQACMNCSSVKICVLQPQILTVRTIFP